MINKKDKITDIELELSTYCNAECLLCYRNYKSFDQHYPKNISRKLKDIKNQLDEYKNLKDIRLVGSISEPTLYKEFLNLVKYIKNRNISIEICTNGDTKGNIFWKELGKLLQSDDRIYFTICGSTQTLHEKYRNKTNLNNILKNAKTFRQHNNYNIDYAQCIRFQYNDEDFNSNNFKQLISQFSNIYMTETFLHQDKNIYKNQNIDHLKPFEEKFKQYNNIKKLADISFQKGFSKEANCKAFNEHRLQLDIYGNEYPCYLFLEASNGKLWDHDWQRILNMEYECCKYCEKNIVQICEEKDLDYII